MRKLCHRIILTELCNRSCEHCFNANFRKKESMDVDVLIRWMRNNSIDLHERELKVMGGEPTLHPRFIDVIDEAYRHYRNTNIFTNGTTLDKYIRDPRIIKCHFEGSTNFKINSYTFEPEIYLKNKDFIRNFILHCVIPLDNVDSFIERIFEFMRLDNVHRIGFTLSPNSQLNLFDEKVVKKYRKSWLKAITTLVPIWRQEDRSHGFDHYFPTCFVTEEMLEELHKFNLSELGYVKLGCCSKEGLGLIDTDFNLWFCNQTRLPLGSILDDTGEIIPLYQIERMLQKSGRVKQDAIRELSEQCRNCKALEFCNIGCYYNALVKYSS